VGFSVGFSVGLSVGASVALSVGLSVGSSGSVLQETSSIESTITSAKSKDTKRFIVILLVEKYY
jgi:hypothetical protein